MNEIDLEQAADVLNDYLKNSGVDDKNRKPYIVNDAEVGNYLYREGTISLGRGAARALLESMGLIVAKTLYLEDRDQTRIWFEEITTEEVEVTRTETRHTFKE